MDVTAPAPPAWSALVPGSVQARQNKRWRADNAKNLGQRRAIEKLEVHPKQVKVPDAML